MIIRLTRTAALAAASALAGGVLASGPASATTGTGPSGPAQGYLVQALPDLETAIETTTPGSIFVRPGATAVKVGPDSINAGFVIHFHDGGPVTYGLQEYLAGKWYDMAAITKTDPRDGCAMGGGDDWTIQAVMPGTVEVRGFSRQDGTLTLTPTYEVTVAGTPATTQPPVKKPAPKPKPVKKHKPAPKPKPHKPVKKAPVKKAPPKKPGKR